jgi:luciferase family oxidoreductase group 1
MPPLSVLELCPIIEGHTEADALKTALEAAQAAERFGFHRVWVAEHHNMAATASSATSVLIAHIGAHTKTIRVGSGGVMLPNHAPYLIAEQFGTLAALHPGRIDLGIGRSPGTDASTLRALRRDPRAEQNYPRDVQELIAYLAPSETAQAVRAIPGQGAEVPVWILGSSLSSAELAALLGLPYAFAAHVQPKELLPAIQFYRENFKPSKQLAAPYVMACINLYAAETEHEARRHYSTHLLGLVRFFRGTIGPVQAPVDDIEAIWTPQEKGVIEHMNAVSIVGSPQTIAAKLKALFALTQADEIMIAGNFHDPEARIKSLQLVAECAQLG